MSEKKTKVGMTVEKTIHKEVQGTKKRVFYVSTDCGDVMVESSIETDSPEELINYALVLIDETKKSKGDLSYVT